MFSKIIAMLRSSSKSDETVAVMNEYAIHKSARAGDLKTMKHLLETNIMLLEEVDGTGRTPLLLAAQYQFTRGVHYLISKGPNFNVAVNQPGHLDHGKTALHLAYASGQYKIIEILIQAGAIDTPFEGEYIWHKIAKDGQRALIQLFYEKQPSLLNQKDSSGNTAMMLASAEGWEDIVLYLTTLGADLSFVPPINPRNIIDEIGYTVLMLAAKQGDINAIQHLTSIDDIDLNQRVHKPGNPDHGKTALDLAYEKKHQITLCYLLQAGAEVDLLTQDGKERLLVAAQCGCIDLVEKYLNKYNHQIETQPEMAGFRDECILTLLRSAEVFSVESDQFFVAVRNGYNHVLQYLLHKAPPAIEQDRNFSASSSHSTSSDETITTLETEVNVAPVRLSELSLFSTDQTDTLSQTDKNNEDQEYQYEINEIICSIS